MDLLLLIALIIILLVVAAALIFVRRKPSDKKEEPKQAKNGIRTKKKAAAEKTRKKSGQPKPEAVPPAAKKDTSTAILGGEVPKPVAMPSAQLAEIHAADGEKIRILIVDDNTGTRENVSRLLYFEEDLQVIGQAVNGRQGVKMAAELKPHIVLMDINMPDMDGITATKEMSVQAPFSQVIIMSVQSDQHYMKRAMAAGARDFQPKPFTSEELVSCIRRVYAIGQPAYRQFAAMEHTKTQQEAQPAQPEEQKLEGAPVIVVYSPKGGVGTSAIATNLAVALHQKLGNTVLMDGALQFGDILVHLNTRPTRTVTDLIHEGELEEELVADILLPHDSGIKLLLAPSRPEMAEAISAAMVAKIVKTLKNQSNAVVIDTAANLTDVTLAFLEHADYLLLVATPDLPAIKNAKLFLELAAQLELNLDKLHLVINKANIPGGIKTAQIEKVLNHNISFRVPYDNRMYIGLNQGRPVCQHETNVPSAQAISRMSTQVWEQFLGTPNMEKEPA